MYSPKLIIIKDKFYYSGIDKKEQSKCLFFENNCLVSLFDMDIYNARINRIVDKYEGASCIIQI